MILRPYQKQDSEMILSWILDEKSFYQWSAGRIGKYPPEKEALNQYYASFASSCRLIPITACRDDEKPMGHFFIRYPYEDKKIVRLGFIIVDSSLRGKGTGRHMVQAAVDYAFQALDASKVTLGVFANNPGAFRCYMAAGFSDTGIKNTISLPLGEWECIELEKRMR